MLRPRKARTKEKEKLPIRSRELKCVEAVGNRLYPFPPTIRSVATLYSIAARAFRGSLPLGIQSSEIVRSKNTKSLVSCAIGFSVREVSAFPQRTLESCGPAKSIA